ncbi:MAG TPA: M1 family metallopeptidase, partial [Polyangiaceae bacterium]
MRASQAQRSLEKFRDVTLGVAALGLAALIAPRIPRASAGEIPDPTPVKPAAPPATEPAITPESPPRVASYTLSAKLDAPRHEITASGTLVFRNVSEAPLAELYFHLYLNAFKNEKSLFLRSPFGEGRGGGRAEDWGYIDVAHCRARELDGVDLWPGRTPGTPSEPDDETDVRVPLPRPLEPGASLTLDLEWKAKLPAVVLRTGHARDFHFVGQWFPKLARLEPTGRFAHFPFHPQAEFYADYGDYDVTLDVPAAALSAATGERVESHVRGDRRVERYRARAVHDFAWTAWPGFRERTARIDGVAVRLLHPEGYETAAETTLATLARALPLASRLYGRYPYPTLTAVHPPEHAAEAGGMEYPTLITTGGPWYLGLLGDRALESVTIHELLHQWFYGLVATNEAAAPILDEGVTSYAELHALEAAYGPGSAFRGFGVELSATALARALSAARAEDLPVASPAADFPGFRALAALVYS